MDTHTQKLHRTVCMVFDIGSDKGKVNILCRKLLIILPNLKVVLREIQLLFVLPSVRVMAGIICNT